MNRLTQAYLFGFTSAINGSQKNANAIADAWGGLTPQQQKMIIGGGAGALVGGATGALVPGKRKRNALIGGLLGATAGVGAGHILGKEKFDPKSGPYGSLDEVRKAGRKAIAQERMDKKNERNKGAYEAAPVSQAAEEAGISLDDLGRGKIDLGEGDLSFHTPGELNDSQLRPESTVSRGGSAVAEMRDLGTSRGATDMFGPADLGPEYKESIVGSVSPVSAEVGTQMDNSDSDVARARLDSLTAKQDKLQGVLAKAQEAGDDNLVEAVTEALRMSQASVDLAKKNVENLSPPQAEPFTGGEWAKNQRAKKERDKVWGEGTKAIRDDIQEAEGRDAKESARQEALRLLREL
jgi:hypothetical protein